MKIKNSIITAAIVIFIILISSFYFVIGFVFKSNIENSKVLFYEKYRAIESLNTLSKIVPVNFKAYNETMKSILKLDKDFDANVFVLKQDDLYMENAQNIPTIKKINLNNMKSSDILQNSFGEDKFFNVKSTDGKNYAGIYKAYSFNGSSYTLGYITNKSDSNLRTKIINFITVFSLIFLLVFVTAANFLFSRYSTVIEYINKKLFEIKNRMLLEEEFKGDNSELQNIIKNLEEVIKEQKKLVFAISEKIQSSSSLKKRVEYLIKDAVESFKGSLEFEIKSRSEIEKFKDGTERNKNILNDINDDISMIQLKSSSNNKFSNELEHIIQNIEKKLNLFYREFSDRIKSWDHLEKKIQDNREVLSKLTNRIKDINSSANEIFNALNLINAITAKTSMLSMSASIQAAHAGEYGKGFSIVAGEIQKLAEASQDRTNSITVVVRDLKKKLDATDQNGEDSSMVFDDLIEETRTSHNSQKEMLNSIEDLRTLNRDISKNLFQVFSSSGEIKNKTTSLFNAIQKTISNNNEDLEISKQVLDSCNSKIKNVENMLIKIEDLRVNSLSLAGNFSRLSADIKNFEFDFNSNSKEKEIESEEDKDFLEDKEIEQDVNLN